jgi:primosomal protein N' (replication factor Y)
VVKQVLYTCKSPQTQALWCRISPTCLSSMLYFPVPVYFPMPMYLQIALATGLRQEFTYLAPNKTESSPLPEIGLRVRVSFGRSERVGLIIGITETTTLDLSKLKPITELLDKTQLLPKEIWQLGLWAAEYYQYPVGDALMHLLPAKLRQPLSNHLIQLNWQIADVEADFGRAKKQQSVWQQLRQLAPEFNLSQLQTIGIKPSQLKPFLDKNLLTTSYPKPQKVTLQLAQQGLDLNPEQSQIVEHLAKVKSTFSCNLLNGVTGSGKTEVYFHAIADQLQSGQRTLLLVPEIGLTPQLLQRLEQRFNNRVLALHSGLTEHQRLNAWQQAGLGQADIIIGTRSALFTPIPELGLIIIDEEHDQAYKQQEGFRYHGRDLAIKRAADANIPILLGSATPSLESLANVERGRFSQWLLTQRAGKASNQRYEVIDLRNQPQQAGISEQLQEMVKVQLELGHQVLLMLNRRGFAPSLQCQSCGTTAQCPACDANMTLHRSPPRLHCHHCEHQQPVYLHCPQCQSNQLKPLGQGTERTEEQLTYLFPNTPVHRIDRDTTRKKGSLEGMLEQVHGGEPCILVGTQMLAKGHHFPNVTLAAILDADASLFSSDFRGPEKLAQLLVQTAGRAGRAKIPGTAVIQTYQADHPTINILVRQGYNAFAQQELAIRQQSGLPPVGHMALFHAQAKDAAQAFALLHWLGLQVQNSELLTLTKSLLIFGPMPAFMARRAHYYRAQLQLQHPNRKQLQQLLKQLCQLLDQHPAARKIRWSLDIDPQELG